MARDLRLDRLGAMEETLVIIRDVHPGRENDYARWQPQVLAAMGSVDGYLGANVLVAAQGATRTLVARFRDAHALNAWETSPQRDRLVEAADRFSTAHYQRAAGLATWFTVPGAASPPRWKMCVVMFPAAYVLTTSTLLVLMPMQRVWSFWEFNAVTNLIITVGLTYGALPLLSRYLGGWLHAPAGGWRGRKTHRAQASQ